MITFLRFTTILALCFVTVIVVPAHYMNGSPLWLVAGGRHFTLLPPSMCLLTRSL